MAHFNLDDPEPGQPTMLRLPPEKWLAINPLANTDALERQLLNQPYVPHPIIDAMLLDDPPIGEAGRVLFISLPKTPTKENMQAYRALYGASLHVFRKFCTLPVIIDARVLAEKMISRQEYDTGEGVISVSDLITGDCDFLALQNFVGFSSPQVVERLLLAISGRLWRPSITVIIGTATESVLTSFPIIRSPQNSEIIRVVEV